MARNATRPSVCFRRGSQPSPRVENLVPCIHQRAGWLGADLYEVVFGIAGSVFEVELVERCTATER